MFKNLGVDVGMEFEIMEWGLLGNVGENCF